MAQFSVFHKTSHSTSTMIQNMSMLCHGGHQRLAAAVWRRVSVTSSSSVSSFGRRFSSDVDAKSSSRHLRVLPPPIFYVPKTDRQHRPAFQIDYMIGETRLTRNKRTCPTRDLNFTDVQWGRHKSPYRKWRHMANFTRAAPFQRLLFPDLAGIAFVGGALTYYNEMYASATTLLSISPSAFTGATAAISILAGFRLNASYGRYREGRQYWSMVNTAARDLARQSFLWIRSKDDALPLQQAQARMVRYTQAFPVALLFHVNDKGGHHNMTRKPYHTFDDRVLAEFQAELQDVYGCRNTDPSLDDALQKDLGQILHTKQQGGNAPLEIILGMSQILQICQRYDHIHPCYIREMEQQIQQFAKALGSCERIVKTPLPTGYSRHSSRLLFIWSHTLPLALYPLLGPWGTVPTSLLTAYAVLGIEDISIQFEDPFDILPLRQYSDAMFDSVKAIEEAFQRKRKEAH